MMKDWVLGCSFLKIDNSFGDYDIFIITRVPRS